MADLSEEELQALYCWIDEIPLSRAKKNIARDFSDGGERAPYYIIARSIFIVDSLVYLVLTAEIVHHFLPHLVELHNYSPANSSTHKIENWRTLNSETYTRKLIYNAYVFSFSILLSRESIFKAKFLPSR